MALSPGTRLGRYEVVAPLGAGGMGEVFRARDTKLDRDVALKVLPDHFLHDRRMLARFETEARAVAALSHPNIVALFDVGEANGIPYAVAELLEGETLRAFVSRGPVPARRALEIAHEIAEGLAAAHGKGIVHRDVKPENVFLTRDGHAKLLDFGIARQETAFREPNDTRTPTLSVLTEAGSVVGTVAYMSPEQARGLPVDHRSDQFSLGAVLYEMLAGKKAFRADTAADVLAAIIRDEPTPLDALVPGVSVPVRVLVERLLAKDPAERWESTRDLVRDLVTWAQRGGEKSGVTEAAGTGTGAAARPARRSRALAAVAACVVVAGLLAGAYHVGRARGAGERPSPGPVPKLVQLTWEPGFEGSPSLSRDGGSLVYVVREAGQTDIFMRRVGGENPTNLTSDFPGDDSQPALSPDGTKIAFRSEREGGGIFLMGATGESPRRLTDFGYDPAWSPDGREIAFATSPWTSGDGELGGALWAVNVATGAQRRLHEGTVLSPAWSPSGSRIAVTQVIGHSQNLGVALSTVPAAGGEPAVVLELAGMTSPNPAWTRGGITFDNSASGVMSVWRVPVNETTGTATGPPAPILTSAEDTALASWTPDERRMAFTSGSGTHTIERLGFDPVRGRLDGARVIVLAGRRDLRPVALSPDGEWLVTVVLDPGGPQDIVLLRPRTGETRRLTEDGLVKLGIVWSPDGSRVYFGIAPEGTLETWSVRRDGSGRLCEVRAAAEGGVDPWFVTPDGRTLYVAVGPENLPHAVDLSVPPAKRSPVPLPPAPGGHRFVPSVLSPDGRWLAGRARSSGIPPVPGPLLLFDTERQTYEELPDLPAARLCGFLPDSRRLLLVREGEFVVLDRETRRTAPAGSIGSLPGYQTMPYSLSRDGRSLYLSTVNREADIWMLDLEAGLKAGAPP